MGHRRCSGRGINECYHEAACSHLPANGRILTKCTVADAGDDAPCVPCASLCDHAFEAPTMPPCDDAGCGDDCGITPEGIVTVTCELLVRELADGGCLNDCPSCFRMSLRESAQSGELPMVDVDTCSAFHEATPVAVAPSAVEWSETIIELAPPIAPMATPQATCDSCVSSDCATGRFCVSCPLCQSHRCSYCDKAWKCKRWAGCTGCQVCEATTPAPDPCSYCSSKSSCLTWKGCRACPSCLAVKDEVWTALHSVFA